MKRAFLILSFLIVLISCKKRTVQLPETANKDITEVLDVSPIYMFYDEENDSVDFNRSNMIGTTNWLVNIDKRLTLKQILLHLKYLQEKRNKDGMHKNDAARNYFTCSNPEIQNLAFIDFTDVVYHDEPIIDFITDYYSDQPENKTKLLLNFTESDSLYISDQLSIEGFKKDEIENVLIKKTSETDSSMELFLTFNENLSFQDYIYYKTILLEAKENNVIINVDEFIYN